MKKYILALITLVLVIFLFYLYSKDKSAANGYNSEYISEQINTWEELNCLDEYYKAFNNYYEYRELVLNDDGPYLLLNNPDIYDKDNRNIFLAFENYKYNKNKVDFDKYLSYAFVNLTAAKNQLDSIQLNINSYEFIREDIIKQHKDSIEKVFDGLRGLRKEYNKEPRTINTGRYSQYINMIEEAWSELKTIEACGDLSNK